MFVPQSTPRINPRTNYLNTTTFSHGVVCQEESQSIYMFRLQEISEFGKSRKSIDSREDLGVLLQQKGWMKDRSL